MVAHRAFSMLEQGQFIRLRQVIASSLSCVEAEPETTSEDFALEKKVPDVPVDVEEVVEEVCNLSFAH